MNQVNQTKLSEAKAIVEALCSFFAFLIHQLNLFCDRFCYDNQRQLVLFPKELSFREQ